VKGSELRRWRLMWFGPDDVAHPVYKYPTFSRFKCAVCGDTRYAGGVQRASEWCGVPVQRWKRWECPSSTVPRWVVERMMDPYLNPGCDNRCRERVFKRAWRAATTTHGGEK
jgi:hypothetical protein